MLNRLCNASRVREGAVSVIAGADMVTWTDIHRGGNVQGVLLGRPTR